MSEAEITRPRKQIWAAYNHLPGGQVVVIHFEDFLRGQMRDGKKEEVLITAKEQVEGFRKTPQVAINIKGAITMRQVLIYDGPDVQGEPDAADRVIAWALEKGIRPIMKEKVLDPIENTRLAAVEKDVAEMKGSLAEILAAVKAVPALK